MAKATLMIARPATRQRPVVPTSLQFFRPLKWLDGRPLLTVIEPYRQRIFQRALDTYDSQGNPLINLVLAGRAKKNWKSTDLILAALDRFLAWDSPAGNQCLLLANDEDQAADDLELAVKLIKSNPVLKSAVKITAKEITRRDGKGYLLILPAKDIAGSHGGTYLFCGFDEIHAYRDWNLLEALQPDATRPDALMWISSYASLFHKPGTPLYDLMKAGRAGTDPKFLFSWYGADFTTDPAYQAAHITPEDRANPSRATFVDGYLAQQAARLPAHKYRRLHLNLPGLPEGSAFTAESVMAAVDRTRRLGVPDPTVNYLAFVDMAGGSSDDACLAIGHQDTDDSRKIVIDLVINQGQPPPYDPRQAISRFVDVLIQYKIFAVVGDQYAGQTFASDFARYGIAYRVSPLPTAKLYEAFEPLLNAGQVVLPPEPLVEQQLLGLCWRGNKIDHPNGEHDDWATVTAGVTYLLSHGAGMGGVVLAGRPTQQALDGGLVPLNLTPNTPVLTPSDYRSLERQREILDGPGSADRSRGGLII